MEKFFELYPDALPRAALFIVGAWCLTGIIYMLKRLRKRRQQSGDENLRT